MVNAPGAAGAFCIMGMVMDRAPMAERMLGTVIVRVLPVPEYVIASWVLPAAVTATIVVGIVNPVAAVNVYV
jgi:TRAP-type mannitol/chloroaromatic compound transport system permease large subunit